MYNPDIEHTRKLLVCWGDYVRAGRSFPGLMGIRPQVSAFDGQLATGKPRKERSLKIINGKDPKPTPPNHKQTRSPQGRHVSPDHYEGDPEIEAVDRIVSRLPWHVRLVIFHMYAGRKLASEISVVTMATRQAVQRTAIEGLRSVTQAMGRKDKCA